MDSQTVTVGSSAVDIVTNGAIFIGLGAATNGGRIVRSGRLPVRPYTQTFKGADLAELRLLGIDQTNGQARIKLQATFHQMPIMLMRDHSFDPMHALTDWEAPVVVGDARLDIVLKEAGDDFGGVEFTGFSYHYEYESESVPIFYLYDRATWELDGDINGATVISQSSCSPPVAKFDSPEAAWSTEGVLFFLVEAGNENPIMTHNLPRWASHQAFDYQYKADATLLGVFDHVDLIRSVVQRDSGKAELKHFDKHIFDQTLMHATTPKAILLNEGLRSEVDQQNLWTWTLDGVHNRARAEFGLAEEPLLPRLSVNYWQNFTMDTYYKDLLPAAAAVGFKRVFVDNLNKSDMSENSGRGGNMCGGHEYEPAPSLGGAKKLKELVDDFKADDIQIMSWTNNDQSYSSPINYLRQETQDWFVRMEDCRLKYGGAYTNGFAIFDFKNDDARRYWVDSLKRIREETGLNGYLFDSFYNLGFMSVNYSRMTPTTYWKQLLQAFKELQDADVHFLIESLGPFGQPQHGTPTSYNLDVLFACYKIGLGSGYTTVPTGEAVTPQKAEESALLYRILAHMTDCSQPLFTDGVRIDKIWSDLHKRALADYYANRKNMVRRFLQEDGLAVIWHDADGRRATIFNFVDREIAFDGELEDVSTGTPITRINGRYNLCAQTTYVLTGAPLPTTL